MPKYFLIGAAGLVLCLVAACQAAKPAAPAAEATPTPIFTIREVMKAMVEPRADSLWNAVATSSTAAGIETKAPTTDEEWAKLRYEAVTLVEAMDAIQVPGRKVARPGEKIGEDAPEELSPEQIEALINQDRASWAMFARALQDSVMVALKTIDAKDVDGLSNAGSDIDTACENCHKKYWYPNDKKPGAN